MDKIICVVGPTASGKTALAVELAKRLDGEVVGCDSMQLYRTLNIGTAKPTADEMRGVPHHMIDILEPTEEYSAARYVADATRAVEDILARKKAVIVAGGTGLYMDSLIRGLDFSSAENRDIIRARLARMYDRFGAERMHRLLRSRDPEAAERIHPNDRKRLVRALEISFSGGSISEHDRETRERPPRFSALKIGVTYADRAELYRRIDERVDEMMAAGLLNEARRFAEISPATAAQAISYKELLPALADARKLGGCVETLKRSSRRYAKRQLTWFRRDERTVWFCRDRESFGAIADYASALCEEFLSVE